MRCTLAGNQAVYDIVVVVALFEAGNPVVIEDLSQRR